MKTIKQYRQNRYRKTVNSGYSEGGASYKHRTLKGMIPNSTSPAEDIHDNLQVLRERNRMLFMDAPPAASAIKINRTNVIGNGLRLKSTINRESLGMDKETAEAWQKKTEAEFKLWANKKENCDATRMNNFNGMQQLCLMSQLLSGDVFVLMKHAAPSPLSPYGLRLHIVEADRIRTPFENNIVSYTGSTTGRTKDGNQIFDGVEIDSGGAVVAYHVANTYPDQLSSETLKTEFSRIDAYGGETGLPNILHLMESERPDQYRGVPYLSQVIKPLLQLRRYTEAEIASAVIQSFFSAWVITNQDAGQNPFGETIPKEDQVADEQNEYELSAGTVNFMEDGEDVKFGSPSHPNAGFDVFVRAMCEQVGAALEVPADLLLKSFNSSYSASRAALLEAWKAFRMRRQWFTEDFCQPIYEIWMSEAVARGRISAPGFFNDPIIRQAYLESEWIGPSPGQLDPTKEVAAEISQVENGFSTREQSAIRLNGSEYTANVDKLAVENEQLAAAQAGKEPELGEKIQQHIEKTAQNAVKKEEEEPNED